MSGKTDYHLEIWFTKWREASFKPLWPLLFFKYTSTHEFPYDFLVRRGIVKNQWCQQRKKNTILFKSARFTNFFEVSRMNLNLLGTPLKEGQAQIYSSTWSPQRTNLSWAALYFQIQLGKEKAGLNIQLTHDHWHEDPQKWVESNSKHGNLLLVHEPKHLLVNHAMIQIGYHFWRQIIMESTC